MKTFIIAEAGVNHNGSLELAKQLADEAKRAGADCIKYQTFVTKNITTKQAKQAAYQTRNTEREESQYEMLKKLELSFEAFTELSAYCATIGIDFLSTGFDHESIDFLANLGMNVWKIPSGDLTNYPMLVKIASFGQPVIVSTGMATMEEIEAAIEVLTRHGVKELTVLHCTTEYPAPLEEVHLAAMRTIGETFGVPVGYSDHTAGITVPIGAVALGARVIEKHFTLDRTMEGPDHKASLEPSELAAMVKGIREMERAIGQPVKHRTRSEEKNAEVARKSLVAARSIRPGELFSADNVTVKRPGTGMSPMNWPDIMGKPASRAYGEDEAIDE